MKISNIVKFSVLLFVAAGQILNAAAQEVSKPKVVVSSYPLKYFAERLAGEFAEIDFPAAETEDPAMWRPRPVDLINMQQADLIIINGGGYEKWLTEEKIPADKVLNSSKGFEDKLIDIDQAVEAAGPAVYGVWLDFGLAQQQARAIAEALKNLVPPHAACIASSLSGLIKDLQDLDAELEGMLSYNNRQPLIMSDPVFKYFERRYSLNVKYIDWQANRMPDQDQWRELKSVLLDYPAVWMIWDDEPLPEVANKLQELGVGSVVFRSADSVPKEGDFLTVMKHNLQELNKAFPS